MEIHGMSQQVVIKKNPISIVKNFLILQFGAVILYVCAGFLAHYAEIYRSLAVSQFMSFQIAQALFIFFIETVIIFFIFFYWYKEYFIIKSNQIIHGWGIVFRKEAAIPFEHISSVTFRQSPLGRLTKYGTVELKNAISGQVTRFRSISDPQEFVDRILQYKQSKIQQTRSQSVDPKKLLTKGEHENLEYKCSFRWDMRQKKVNKNLEKSVMKTIAAFLNSKGGHVIMGVDDAQNVVGIEHDYKTLGRMNADGFETHFSHIFNDMIGAEFRQRVSLAYAEEKGKEYCVVSVVPSPKPVYLRFDDKEEFYIRTGNGTTSLRFSEATAYIDTRFLRSRV